MLGLLYIEIRTQCVKSPLEKREEGTPSDIDVVLILLKRVYMGLIDKVAFEQTSEGGKKISVDIQGSGSQTSASII